MLFPTMQDVTIAFRIPLVVVSTFTFRLYTVSFKNPECSSALGRLKLSTPFLHNLTSSSCGTEITACSIAVAVIPWLTANIFTSSVALDLVGPPHPTKVGFIDMSEEAFSEVTTEQGKHDRASDTAAAHSIQQCKRIAVHQVLD
jgi:hypothetical protein